MIRWKHFDHKIYSYAELDYDIKIKDICNSIKKKKKIRPYFIRYVLPIKQNISIPIVFNWNLGGKKVYIYGSWDNWFRKIPLTYSNKDFNVVIPLFPDKFFYRFVVDGQKKYAVNHKVKIDICGKTNNITDIKNFERNVDFDDSLSDNGNDMFSEIWNRNDDFKKDFMKEPPIIPPHLASLFVINLTNKVKNCYSSFLDFPIDIHVFLNHLFFFSSEKLIVNLKKRIPALRARISEKIVNLIFWSKKQPFNYQELHPVKRNCT